MDPLFTNPLTLIAGGLLVSSPIIIHLINRMRFRRIRWAAMEFLLKAQKRMRRKMIIEQLILLLLRCLLVFLIGLLLARFKWFSPLQGQETRATAHIILLDDSPSMGDTFLADGRQTDAFEQAKAQIIDKIAPAAAQANTPQSMDVVLLSELGNPRPYERLNESAIEDMKAFLSPMRASPVRVSVVDGLRRAKQLLDAKPDSDVAKVIHIVSDLRAIDWVEDGETIKQITTELTANGVQIHLIDVAHPHRKDTDRTPRSSDNVGIVEFRPMAKTAARYQPVEFEVRVKNFGGTELKDVRIRFFLNGKGNVVTDRTIPSLPPNQERREIVQVIFDRLGTPDKPLDRFSLVTAEIATPEQGGIAIDNARRHAVVEVQERLSVLAIEGRPNLRDNPKGDGFYLKRLFQDAFGGINWVDGTVADLEKKDLRQYAAVYLLNVPAIKKEAIEKLEAYVRGGGGLGVFLGPDVRGDDYNKDFFRGGDGAFPVPLDKITDPITTEYTLVLSKQVLTRDLSVKLHPALAGLYTNDRGGAIKDTEIEKYFNFPSFERYWKVPRIGRWKEDQATRELYCYANKQPVTAKDDEVQAMLRELKAKASEPKYEKYRNYLDPLEDKIKITSSGYDPDVPRIPGETNKPPPMAKLAIFLDRLLCDQINDGDESEPILREFWALPEMAELKAKAQKLRDEAKFGDTLYVVKQFGHGRVAVMTTDAGGSHGDKLDQQWTNWPSTAGVPGWVAVVSEMQKYLSGGGSEENRLVGSAITTTFDAAKYKPTVVRTFVTGEVGQGEKQGDVPIKETGLGDQPLEAKGGNLEFRYAEANKPGVYLFTFTQLTPNEKNPEKPEYAAFAFNVDAQREGDLRRANRDDLAQQAPNVPLHSPEDTSWVNALKQKRDDLSTRRWLYLVILLVLVAEQAMAVRLSYHMRPEDLDLHAPSAAAVFQHDTAPSEAEAAEQLAETT